MNIPIPAICTSDECGLLFPTSVSVAEGSSAEIINCIAKCPKCSSKAQVLEGIHFNFSKQLITLIKSSSKADLIKLAHKLQKELNRNKSPKNILKSLTNFLPNKSKLLTYVPKSKKSAIFTLFFLYGAISGAIELAANIKSLTDNEIEATIIAPAYDNSYRIQNNYNIQNHNYYPSQPSPLSQPQHKNQVNKPLLPPKQTLI